MDRLRMIDKVEEHLYLGSAYDVLQAAGQAQLKSLKITHVLTISAMPVAEADRLPGVTYMFAFAMDVPRQDLLGASLLDGCLRFIADAISEDGNVFVHWSVSHLVLAALCRFLSFAWDFDASFWLESLSFLSDQFNNSLGRYFYIPIFGYCALYIFICLVNRTLNFSTFLGAV